MQNKKILLGLTTTPRSDWRKKIQEIKKFNITELALFPTFLNAKQRQELYALLKNTSVVNIPHVHLRDDMTMDEIEYLISIYHTQYFNIHPASSRYSSRFDYGKYNKQIYVENSGAVPSADELKKYAGLCVDFAHWENGKNGVFNDFEMLVQNNSIKCCHISAMRFNWWKLRMTDAHTMKKLSDLDYIKNYIKYLPEIISLELENDFKDQLEAKKYLQIMLDNYGNRNENKVLN
jgi:hypothetical protein